MDIPTRHEGAEPLLAPKAPDGRVTFRDPAFAALFLASLCGAIYSSVDGGRFLAEESSGSAADSASPNVSLLGAFVGLCLFAAVAAVACLTVIVKSARTVIQLGLVANVAAWACLTIYFGSLASRSDGYLVSAILCAALTLLALCYARLVQKRIPFASAVLVLASKSLQRYWGTVVVAFGMTAVAFALMLLLGLGVLGLVRNYYEATDDGAGTLQSPGGEFLFLIVLCMFWYQQVCQNVVHVTTAGTVASWWFSPSDFTLDAPATAAATAPAFKRATTTSFGSICFGSLLVAIVEFLRSLARSAAKRDNNALACIAHCLISCIDDCLRFINRYAFCYVAIYGYSFVEAGKLTIRRLFSQRGFSAIINDNLISNCLTICAALVGLATAGIGAFIAFLSEDLQNVWGGDENVACNAMAVIGLFFGFLIALVVMNVVFSAVASIFVMVFENLDALYNNHTEDYRQLLHAMEIYIPDAAIYQSIVSRSDSNQDGGGPLLA